MSKKKRRGWRPKLSPKLELHEDPAKKVAIATPAMDMCHTAYALSLVNMCLHTVLSGEPVGVLPLTYGTSILPFSRQHLAQVAVKMGMTHILWIDSDMSFPPDSLLRLMRHDKPIVGINAMTRREPFRTTAKIAGQNIPTSRDSSGLEKVDLMGFGMVWMSTDILQTLGKPWFDVEWVPEKEVHRGEDYFFFEKAKAAGHELYVDHDLSKQVGHIGTFTFNPQMLGAEGVK